MNTFLFNYTVRRSIESEIFAPAVWSIAVLVEKESRVKNAWIKYIN